MKWYYAEEGRQVGPVDDAQLAELNRSGKINADTLVWREGMSDWLPFGQVLFRAPAPGQSNLSGEPNAAPPAAAAIDPSQAICAECGKSFPIGETIPYGNVRICATCKPVFIQKLSEGARLNDGQMNYAGFGIRFGAKFIDGLILGVPMMVILFAVMWPAIKEQTQDKQADSFQAVQLLPMLVQIGFVFVQLGYQTFFVGKYGATPGKMACKLKIVTADGAPLGYGRAACRSLAEMLSGMACYIGYFLVLFDAQKRALHDHICNTRVIHKDK